MNLKTIFSYIYKSGKVLRGLSN